MPHERVRSLNFLIEHPTKGSNQKRGVLESWCERNRERLKELLEYKDKDKEKEKNMALKEFDISTIPQGRITASEPGVRVAENGQIALNTKAAEPFKNGEEMKFARVLFDADTRALGFQAQNSQPKGKTYLPVAHPQKSKGVTISCAGLLRQLEYDYRAAGAQTFDAEIKGKGKDVVVFTVPSETPTPRPKRTRKRKEKSTEGEQASTTDETAGEAPTTTEEEIEI